jgi:putative oxidoreductase
MTEPSIVAKWRTWSPQLLSVCRIVAGFLFIQFGTMKWFAFPVGMPGGYSAPFGSLIWFAAFLEVIGGALILLGLFTRPVAFILAGEMAVAYFYGHAGNGFWPVVNQGTPAILFCFFYLYLSAAGAGSWSLDAMRQRTSHPITP